MDTAPTGSSRCLEQIHLINLDRGTDRLAKFKERNPHLENVLRISAVDGAFVNREALVRDGIITENLPYSPGTLGCALSHVGLWKIAVSQNRVVTVFEDDTICSHNFVGESGRIVASLPTDWDIIFWGFNFNPSFVWLDYGFSKASLCFYDRQFSSDHQKFQHASLASAAVRVAHSFGTLAYSVSPKGARALLQYCLPLRKRLIKFPGTGVAIDDEGIDMAMSGAYGSMQAFICIPPLVIHDDVQTSDRVARDRASRDLPAAPHALAGEAASA
jgi:GR25 family glycosyltransferase involved in LPS biosynthesis